MLLFEICVLLNLFNYYVCAIFHCVTPTVVHSRPQWVRLVEIVFDLLSYEHIEVALLLGVIIARHSLIMEKQSNVTPGKWAIIAALLASAIRQVNIATQVGCPQAAVSKLLRRNGLNRSNCGRKRNTNARDDRKLRRSVKKRRFTNSSEMS